MILFTRAHLHDGMMGYEIDLLNTLQIYTNISALLFPCSANTLHFGGAREPRCNFNEIASRGKINGVEYLVIHNNWGPCICSDCPSSVIISDSNAAVAAGDTLTCTADAYPAVTMYQWTGVINGVNISSTGSTFVLPSGGEYYISCTATNYLNDNTTPCSATTNINGTAECKKHILLIHWAVLCRLSCFAIVSWMCSVIILLWNTYFVMLKL